MACCGNYTVHWGAMWRPRTRYPLVLLCRTGPCSCMALLHVLAAGKQHLMPSAVGASPGVGIPDHIDAEYMVDSTDAGGVAEDAEGGGGAAAVSRRCAPDALCARHLWRHLAAAQLPQRPRGISLASTRQFSRLQPKIHVVHLPWPGRCLSLLKGDTHAQPHTAGCMHCCRCAQRRWGCCDSTPCRRAHGRWCAAAAASPVPAPPPLVGSYMSSELTGLQSLKLDSD